MKGGNIILMADLIIDFLAVGGLLYLFSQGYFDNIDSADLNGLFFKIGIVGLVLVGATIYLLLKKD